MLQYYCTVVQCSALASLIVAFVEGSEATDVYSVVDDTFLNAYVTIGINFGYGIRSFAWCGHFAYDSWFSNQYLVTYGINVRDALGVFFRIIACDAQFAWMSRPNTSWPGVACSVV
jgi:hypothetical protein